MLYLERVNERWILCKSDEGIFLGYLNKRKSSKCFNLSSNKTLESAHLKIDEFAEKSEEKS